MIEVKELLPHQLDVVRDIAFKTWPVTYRDILSEAQLNYMLDLFYSIPALEKSIDKGHRFLLAYINNEPAGFASYHHNYQNENTTRIPKIYVLPKMHGKGIGKALMETIIQSAISNCSEKISLNVNRNNPAKHFYEKIGFKIAYSEDIELEHGYLMEDYVMELELPSVYK